MREGGWCFVTDEAFQGVFCATDGCGYHFAGQTPDDLSRHRDPCPRCRSTSRQVRMHFSVSATHHASLGLTAIPRGRGRSRWFYRLFDGWEASVKHRTLMRKVSIFDKRDKSNYRRYEKVTDPETGEVIHFQDHDLREHVRHGSDKQNSERRQRGSEQGNDSATF